jgi:erythromycin esterase
MLKPGLVVAALAMPASATAQADPSAAEFLKWARTVLVEVRLDTAGGRPMDLRPFLDAIGRSQVVVFAEATHSGGEVLRVRNALFLALAREKGFRTLAIESGQSEGERLFRYVEGKAAASLDVSADSGFTWTFHQHRANRDLLRQLRAYNETSPARPVRLYGFDVPGSPGNTQAVRGVGTALEEALRYVDRVDPPAAASLRARAAVFLGLTPPATLARYLEFDSAGRDRLTGAVADLVALIERRSAVYQKASSAEEFAWGYRHAIGARQIDSWLRLWPLDGTKNYVNQHKYRDWAMADNVEWIRRREGGQGGVMVFASRFHVAGAPVLIRSMVDADPADPSITLGTHLRSRLGEAVVLIGNAYGRHQQCRAKPASPGIDVALESLGVRSFVLDLRKAPPAARPWLDRTQAMGESFETAPGKAFDIFFYNQIQPVGCTDSTR